MKNFVKERCVLVTRVFGAKNSERRANIQELGFK